MPVTLSGMSGHASSLVMAIHRPALSVVFAVVVLCGCDARTATNPTTRRATTAPTMNFTVEHVFYIKPPVDRVILVGTINDGVVQVGDKLVVHTAAGPIDVAVDNIESIQQGDLKQAAKGQQVGLRLSGIRKDQPAIGDRVTATGGA